MPRKQISQYLFERIIDAGVDCTFGIPGDFILPLYAAQQKAALKTVVMTHEPSVGFAADAYARIKGLGVALVTYGAGGLNMINPTGLAYAEESPLLIVSGGPETTHRGKRALLHHCVKTFATQNNVYAEVTAANAIVGNNLTAKQTIDHVLDTVLTVSRPGYLELPRDMVSAEIEVNNEQKNQLNGLNDPKTAEQLRQILDLLFERLSACRKPVVMAGVQLSRFGLLGPVCQIVEALNIPVVTSIAGKSSFPESHANFVGTYFGQFGDDNVKEFFEDCDCIIALGVMLTETETGGFSAKLPAEKLILINNEEINIGGDNYKTDSPILSFKSFLPMLADGVVRGAKDGRLKKFVVPKLELNQAHSKTKTNLSVAHLIASINNVVDDHICIVCDVGDCLYAGLSIKTDCFIAPGYYSSMGFGVPASIGIQLANKKKRPIVLVGDGGFQMTGTELSTARKRRAESDHSSF